MTAQNEPGRLGEGRPGHNRRMFNADGKASIASPSCFRNADLQSAIEQARSELGLVIKSPVTDGRLHRCPVEGARPGSLDGAYRICLDRPENVWGQNFKTGAKGVFPFGGSSGAWSPAERREFAARAEEDRARREADQRREWDQAARKAEKIYADSEACSSHPYLAAKGVGSFYRLRVSGRDLVVPAYDGFGILRTLQYINPAGQKWFLKGGRKGGCFLTIDSETLNRRAPLLIAEGLSTALSLAQATGYEVRVAFDAGNLRPVALGARKDWPGREIIICADNDAGGGPNIGLEKGRAAAQAIGGLLAVPFLSGGDRRTAVDFNDVFVAEGPEAVKFLVKMAFEPGKGAGHES